MTPQDDKLELRYAAELIVVGLPVTVRSNDATVVDAVRTWFRSVGGAASAAPLQIDVIAAPATEATASGGALVWRRHGATAVAAYGANLLTAQHDRGYGLVFVTPGLIAAEERMITDVIEPLVWELARGQGYMPLRATALGNATAVVIIPDGPDLELEALIHACSASGLTLFAERTLYLSRSERLRLWGGRAADGLGATDIPGRPLMCAIELAAGRVSRLEPIDATGMLPFLQAAGVDWATAQALMQQGAYRLLMGSEPRNAAALLAHLVAEAN